MKVGGVTLKVGDRIRIVRKPNDWNTMQKETKSLFNKLLARKRSVRICKIEDDYPGHKTPWFECRFKSKKSANGWEYHSLAVLDDGSWVKVKPVSKRTLSDADLQEIEKAIQSLPKKYRLSDRKWKELLAE